MIDVVTVGDVFEDLVLSGFDKLPALGEEGYAQSLEREVGGGAATTACGLARLGMSAAIVGCVSDEDSDWFRERIRGLGVRVDHLQRARGRTALSVSVSTLEDRALYTFRGTNRELLISDHSVPPARCVHFALCPTPALLPVMEGLRRRGVFVSLDVGWHPDWLASRDCYSYLRAVDLFLPNEQEAFAITQTKDYVAALTRFEEQGVRSVAIKRGAKGASLLKDGQRFEQKAEAIAVKDTTGAGDCFDAGFLFSLLQGEAPERCLATGVFCGSQSTRALGGIEGFPSREELTQWQTSRR